RRVLPLIEVRADFGLNRAELLHADRGADDTDLEALDKAVHQLAVAENAAVFHGWHSAITGICDATPHKQVPLGDAADAYPRQMAVAVEQLRCGGIAGPYGLA